MHRDVFANVRSEEVVPLVDVFSPGTILGIVCYFQSTTVVLEDSAMYLCRSGMHWESKLLHFHKNPDHR